MDQVKEIVDIVEGYQQLVNRFKQLDFVDRVRRQRRDDVAAGVSANQRQPIKVTDEEYALVKTLFENVSARVVRLYGYDLYWEDSQLDASGRVKS